MAPYSEDELNALKKSVPLWKIVSERIPKFQRKSGEWVFQCPFHKGGKERTPSFTVFRSPEGVWLYKCFGCGDKGSNVFKFIQKYDKVPFEDAVRKVKAEKKWLDAGDDVDSTFKPIREDDRKAVAFPVERIKEAEEALVASEAATRWLFERGITLDTARRFHLGFIQSAAVAPAHPLVGQGWVVIPTIENDQITLLKYRSVSPEASVGDRWLRKQGMKTSLFNLSGVRSSDELFLVEGPFDAMVLAQAGFSAVALDSAAYNPTPDERTKLRLANRLYLAGDNDPPGQQAMEKLWTEFQDRTYKINWPSGVKDANEFFVKSCEGNLERFRIEVEALKARASEQPMPFIHDVRETIKRMGVIRPFEDPARFRFPWKSMDMWTPIVPGDVMVLSASDTKTGKSTFLMNALLFNAIKHNRAVVNYSAEMQPEQYARRAVAYLAHADRNNLQMEDSLKALTELGDARFYNGYKPGANYKDVIELLKWAKRRLGADIIVVDPLPFLIRDAGGRQYEAEGAAMRMLKDLAFELHVIVIVVTQPRKGQPNQKNREMIAQDISGSYTQNTDASQVFLLHRDRKGATVDGEPIFSNVTKVKLEHSRESKTCVTSLWFEGNTASFFEMEPRFDVDNQDKKQ